MDLNLNQEIDHRLEQTLELTLAPKMLAMLKILNLPFQDLLQRVRDESEENVMLEVEHQDEYVEIINYIGSHKSQKREMDFKDFPGIENIGDIHQTLEQYLLDQLNLEKLPTKQHQIAERLISALNADGYILNYPPVREEIEKDFNVSRPTVDKILKVIQTFEPDGVGARNLQECLLIQIREYNFENIELQTIIESIVLKHLDELAEKKYEEIASALNIRTEGVKQVAEFIKNNLSPKPGALFGGEERHIVPSFAFKEDANGKFQIINLETRYGPTLKLSSVYEKMLKEAKDEKTTTYLKEKMERAQELIDGIKKRQETHNKLVAFIVEQQMSYFQKGENWIKPLLQKDIAAALSIHPSTVSRALAEKYMQTQCGVIHLRSLCQRSWKGISKVRMKQLIEEVIKREGDHPPVSDENIKNELAEKGISVSRRTIAEYRKQLKIPSSKER